MSPCREAAMKMKGFANTMGLFLEVRITRVMEYWGLRWGPFFSLALTLHCSVAVWEGSQRMFNAEAVEDCGLRLAGNGLCPQRVCQALVSGPWTGDAQPIGEYLNDPLLPSLFFAMVLS